MMWDHLPGNSSKPQSRSLQQIVHVTNTELCPKTSPHTPPQKKKHPSMKICSCNFLQAQTQHLAVPLGMQRPFVLKLLYECFRPVNNVAKFEQGNVPCRCMRDSWRAYSRCGWDGVAGDVLNSLSGKNNEFGSHDQKEEHASPSGRSIINLMQLVALSAVLRDFYSAFVDCKSSSRFSYN
jgi:hypothetical protein